MLPIFSQDQGMDTFNGTTADAHKNVYVASLPLTVDDQQLHDLFALFGAIASARIMRTKGSHQSKGYGFVLYKDARAAEQAIAALHGQTVSGSRIQVRLANTDASNAFSRSPSLSPANSLPSLISPAAPVASMCPQSAALLIQPQQQSFNFVQLPAPQQQLPPPPQQQQQQRVLATAQPLSVIFSNNGGSYARCDGPAVASHYPIPSSPPVQRQQQQQQGQECGAAPQFTFVTGVPTAFQGGHGVGTGGGDYSSAACQQQQQQQPSFTFQPLSPNSNSNLSSPSLNSAPMLLMLMPDGSQHIVQTQQQQPYCYQH